MPRIFLTLLMLLAGAVQAAPLVLSDAELYLSLTPAMRYLEDPAGTLDIQQVQALPVDAFTPVRGRYATWARTTRAGGSASTWTTAVVPPCVATWRSTMPCSTTCGCSSARPPGASASRMPVI